MLHPPAHIQSARWLPSRGQSRPKQFPAWTVAFGVRLARERASNEIRRLSNCQAERDVTRPSLALRRAQASKTQAFGNLPFCQETTRIETQQQPSARTSSSV